MTIPRYTIVDQRDLQVYDLLLSKIWKLRFIKNNHSGDTLLSLLESAADDLIADADLIIKSHQRFYDIVIADQQKDKR